MCIFIRVILNLIHRSYRRGPLDPIGPSILHPSSYFTNGYVSEVAQWQVNLFPILGIEVMFLYLNVLLQRNQTGKSGWAGFRVPERYDCRTKDHVSYEKRFKVDGLWRQIDRWHTPRYTKYLSKTVHFRTIYFFHFLIFMSTQCMLKIAHNWTKATLNGMKIYLEIIIWFLDKRILGRRISECLWTKWKCYLLGIPPLGERNFCYVYGVFCMSINYYKPGLKCDSVDEITVCASKIVQQ